ncbi:hypothetical protein H2200_003127 [Cladophialophora chaetospira]|uniref:UBA domain-containing protein n=1 Tax=Cladophialophora chaetospira TaxID=386627 RepID=A0AA38XHG9_9EURO|nr:hypothetical protein H2200_003127 [Cladophialophora chaetospira]
MADTMNPMDITYYANDVRAIAPDQDWSLLVSCHVQACISLHDRRAAYSCYACLERGKTTVESSMAALREHLNVCELIRDIKLSDQHRKQELKRPTPPASRRSGKRPEVTPQSPTPAEASGTRRPAGRVETVQNPFSTRNQPSTPSRQARDMAADTLQRGQMRDDIPWESNPPLPSRPKSSAPTDADRQYTGPSTRRPEQPGTASTARPHPMDTYNIPGGFPGQNLAHSDSRASSLHDYSPTVPRRKEVRLDAPGPSNLSSDPKGLPTPPSRAPPAPPVLSPPAPPPYYQGKDTGGNTSHPNSATSTHESHADSFPRVDPVKIQQLVSLGIPRMDAEYLLNRTGGDVNAAAELQLSEMGSLAGPDGPPVVQPHFPAPSGSNPANRNRRPK